jgi:uncharacterized protein
MEQSLKPLVLYLRQHFRLDWHGIHGFRHWGRVLKNGMLIAQAEPDVRKDVVRLFALLHDHERRDDGGDPYHGERAVDNIHARLAGKVFTLDSQGLELLTWAIAEHSNGANSAAPPTVLACWDADRLDLGRVGIRPDPYYLGTATARRPDVIAAAYRRSLS